MTDDYRFPVPIQVVRYFEPGSVFVGRPTLLGNPWPLRGHSDAERSRVCDLYDEWLKRIIAERNAPVMAFLAELQEQAMRPEGLKLGCYCAPRRCHADSIKAVLEHYPTGYFDTIPA